MGTTTKVISIKSRINPSRKTTTITTRTAPINPPGRLLNIWEISSSPPNPRKTSENKEAPTKIAKTIHVISVDERAILVSFFMESCRFTAASTSAPTAPIAEASVGVAFPVKIEPKTKMMSNSGGAKLFIISGHEIFSFSLTLGAHSGFTTAITNK